MLMLSKSIAWILSTCVAARFAATARLRLFRVRFSAPFMPSAAAAISRANTVIATISSMIVKPSWFFRRAMDGQREGRM